MSTGIGERTVDGYATAKTTDQIMERLARAAQPDAVFGQPFERGDTVVIPCCEIALGMGAGGGTGTAQAAQKQETSVGGGMGGGGGARGRPVAAIVISRGTVRVEPIVDATKVAMAALTTTGFVGFWLLRLAGGTQMRMRMRPPWLARGMRMPLRMRPFRLARGRGMRMRLQPFRRPMTTTRTPAIARRFPAFRR